MVMGREQLGKSVRSTVTTQVLFLAKKPDKTEDEDLKNVLSTLWFCSTQVLALESQIRAIH